MADPSTVTAQATQKVAISGGGVIPFMPADKNAVYQSYMPFLKNGGLYVSTTKKYELGAEVFILIKMPDGNDRYPVVGKVVWVNRSGGVSRPSGIGVQFSDTAENVIARDKIEALLMGMSTDLPTFTM